MQNLIFLMALILLIAAAMPYWGHSRGWGYYPSGGLGLVLVVLIALMALGRL